MPSLRVGRPLNIDTRIDYTARPAFTGPQPVLNPE
jgi:hypothetical protein